MRVCEPGPARSCGAQLFAGTLALGQVQQVCAQASTVVYQEFDPGKSSYGRPFEARCDGGDVEL